MNDSKAIEMPEFAQYCKFYESKPADSTGDGSATWYARAANFVVGYTLFENSTILARRGHADEYFMLLFGGNATVEADGKEIYLPGRSVSIIPPGDSLIKVENGPGQIVRIFTLSSPDLVELCMNRDKYRDSHWIIGKDVKPINGYAVRTYEMDSYPFSAERLGRIFITGELMINVLYHRTQRRDVTMMSPHSHDDFEQGSLALSGTFVHHIRTPWGKDMTAWRADEHEVCAAPSLAIIPPKAVHTSQDIGAGVTQLIDIFGPPREDFLKKGWVLNADEYLIEAL